MRLDRACIQGFYNCLIPTDGKKKAGITRFDELKSGKVAFPKDENNRPRGGNGGNGNVLLFGSTTLGFDNVGVWQR
jgi:hypothetical protein